MVKELGDENTLWNVDGLIGMGGGTQPEKRSLSEIVDRLEAVYCRRIGYEYMHIPVRTSAYAPSALV